MTTDGFRYWGFISYSHRDRRWGERLHRQLESYRVPRRLIGSAGAHGPVPARLFPIFHDRAELSTAAGLSDMLTRAIEASRCFIVICSPAAAASRWVNEEIRHAKRSGRADRIFCLIVDGEPYASDKGEPKRECFPPALRYEVGPDGELPARAPEPLAADVRAEGDGRDDARLKLIAGLLGVGFDTLRRRDLQARNRRLGLIAGGAVLISIAMAALAVRAVIAEHAADNARQRGEELIDFMLGDLRDKLEPLGKLDILDAVGDRAMAYFERLDSRNLGEAALVARAKALRQIGDVRFQQGRPGDAATAFDAALALNRRVAALHPADADLQFELAQAEFWAGYTAWRAGQNERAEPHLEAYRQIALRMLGRDPASPRWQLESAYADSNLGSLDYSRHQYLSALDHFRGCADRLLALEPKSEDAQEALTVCLSWQGSTLRALGRAADSLAVLARQVELARALAATHGDDQRLRRRLAYALSAQADGALAADQAAPAGRAAAEGIALADALIARDPGSAENSTLSVVLRLHAAEAFAVLGDPAASARRLAEANRVLAGLRRDDPDQLDLQQQAARAAALAYALALSADRPEQAGDAADEAAKLCAAGSPLVRAVSMHCVEARLQGWEIAALRGADTAAAEAGYRQALASVEAGESRVAVEDLQLRALVLSGRANEAGSHLDALAASGYCPPGLRLFLRRHHLAPRTANPRAADPSTAQSPT